MKRIALFCMLLLSACAGAPNADDPLDAQDPMKPFNKAMFNFNLGADRHFIKPVAEAYHELPGWGREGIGNFLSNLGEPANAVNGLLQAKPDVALTALWRFVLNSTVGFAGLRDFAGENHLAPRPTDFGKTLGSYGVADGAYVVLPILGPSTVRDTTGKVADWFLDPAGWFMTTPESVAQMVADGISTRDDNAAIINQLYYDALEPYSATRAAYLQHQAFQ